MKIKPIKSITYYELTLKGLERIFIAEPETKEGDELEILAMVIEDYKNSNYSIGPSNLLAIKAGQVRY